MPRKTNPTTLTVTQLKRQLHYNPRTGVFTWLVDKPRARTGDVAGGYDRSGYLHIGLNGKRYKGHRLAVLYMTGKWPKSDLDVDHRDTNPSNNRWKNLRVITHQENGENRRKAERGSLTGILGASPHGDRFRAQIVIKGKHHHLGVFDTPEEAHQVYLKAKRKGHAANTL